jgi:aldehyde:ferredoxin oxidoreductase
MPYGYNGKILMVDLSKEKITIEQHREEFYRKYLGGSALGAYYCLREIPPKADPLGPDNVIVFAASIITGAPIPCLSRFNVSAKSPLTGGIADSQAGGFWGPELKFAGYDAVVVKGRAKHPVYIWINNGSVEIKDARHVWGMTTGDTETAIREELKDNRIRFAVIGQGEEDHS